MIGPALVRRVVARFLAQADQPAGQRKRDRELATPINRTRGIDEKIQKDNARTDDSHDDAVEPDRRDIRPSDVFSPSPRSMSVLNFAETGEDQDKVLRTQVHKDKGWDTVKNLSQYLIRTEGGGDTPPAGKNLK